MKKNNLIALMSVSLCVLFLSCSSFDNDIVNEKISDWEQLQRIKDLQADYERRQTNSISKSGRRTM